MGVLEGWFRLLPLFLILTLPPLFLAGLVAVFSGSVPYSREDAELKESGQSTSRRYGVSSFLASIAAEIAVITATIQYLNWTCLHGQDRICHDGQAGMGLMLTVPFSWLIGTLISVLWTTLTLRVRSDRITAAKFRYSGLYPMVNRLLCLGGPVAFWLIAGYSLFLLFTVIGT